MMEEHEHENTRPAAPTVPAKSWPALDKVMKFKSQDSRDLAAVIVTTMLKDRIRWSDDFDFSFVKKASVIGPTWRKLKALGILKRMNQTRPSKIKSANGRSVWRYWMVNEELANKFLDINGRAVPDVKQPEFFGVNLEK